MQKILLSACVAMSLTLTGCASIFSGSTQTLTFKSTPDTANITIVNKAGEKIHTGETPATVTLKRGAGFFAPQNYQVTFSKPGYQSKTIHVNATINGWYVANIIFGGLIGLLIVDPATGAMYSLNPSDVNAVLDSVVEKSETAGKVQSLTVMLVEDVPVEIMQKAKLITKI